MGSIRSPTVREGRLYSKPSLAVGLLTLIFLRFV
jgi:hypothetical protein